MLQTPDAGSCIGMTVALSKLDCEQAIEELAYLGFDAVEVHVSQLAPALAGVEAQEAHATAVGRFLSGHDLIISSLNAAGAAGFEPLRDSADVAADTLGMHLRLAAALGAPRLICWDGHPGELGSDRAPETLASVIEEGRRRSGLAEPPTISVELHPFTFALASRRLGETADALAAVGAGLCIDFCHFGVAVGSDFGRSLTAKVIAATNHVHVADSDCVSSEVHFPFGEGALDVEALASRFDGCRVGLAWDLFGWPTARQAMRTGMERYQEIVDAHKRTLGQ